MSRSADSILHEADYWRTLVTDIEKIDEQVRGAFEAACDVVVNVACAGFLNTSPLIEEALTGSRAVMHRVEEIQKLLVDVLELANGRAIALNAEADGLVDG